MSQKARNLADQSGGLPKDKKYLIRNQDPFFAKEFREILKALGIELIKTLPMSPHLNCLVERFCRSQTGCKDQRLSRT